MNQSVMTYGALGIAITLEIAGTTFLQKSAQFTKLVPTAIMVLCYMGAFYFLSHALKTIPVGIAYAIWSGLGIVLISTVGAVLFRQRLDLAAMIGLGFIVVGVIIVNVFSRSVAH